MDCYYSRSSASVHAAGPTPSIRYANPSMTSQRARPAFTPLHRPVHHVAPITLRKSGSPEGSQVRILVPENLVRCPEVGVGAALRRDQACRRGRYWIASARCAVSIPSLPAKSAIVRASFKIRWYARALMGSCCMAARSRFRRPCLVLARTSSTGQPSRTSAGPTLAGQGHGFGQQATAIPEALATLGRLSILLDRS